MFVVNTKKKFLLVGVLLGIICMLLSQFGNPGNMALCIACFIRDIAGSVKLHQAPVVQYLRPEIVGIVVGSFILAKLTKEYHTTAGSSPILRFVLGFITMIGALVCLGCPLRMTLRVAGGDCNAMIALIGFALGCITGSLFLKKGFSFGRAYETKKSNGYVLPISLIVLFIISLVTTVLSISSEGPGSIHAPAFLSIAGGLFFGMIAQRSRVCFAGGIRDLFLMKNIDLLLIGVALIVSVAIYNVISGNFHFGFDGQPIAHTEWIFNILGMYVVGFAAVLAGGCPLRQLVLAGQGSIDSVVYVLGMLLGAAFCHNFQLASSGAGTTEAGRYACVICIGLLFLIAFTNKKR